MNKIAHCWTYFAMVLCRSSARESNGQVLATSIVFSLVWFTSFHLHESQITENECLKDGKISIHESRKSLKAMVY